MWRSVILINVYQQILSVVWSFADARHYSQNISCGLCIKIWKNDTDRDRLFKSELFHKLSWLQSTRNLHTTWYHSHMHNIVKVIPSTLKSCLQAELSNTNWLKQFLLILLGLCNLVNKESNCSAAETLYGTTLQLLAQYFFDSPKNIGDLTSFEETLHPAILEDTYFEVAPSNIV